MLPPGAEAPFERWQLGLKKWDQQMILCVPEIHVFFLDNEQDFVSAYICRDGKAKNLIDAVEESNMKNVTSFFIAENEIDFTKPLMLKDTINSNQRSTLKQFQQMGDQLGLKMIDYMLINEEAYYSAAENGFPLPFIF